MLIGLRVLYCIQFGYGKKVWGRLPCLPGLGGWCLETLGGRNTRWKCFFGDVLGGIGNGMFLCLRVRSLFSARGDEE